MSFRLEEKIKLHISDLNKVRSHLQFINAKELYPKRKISSIYFDNKFFEMYRDSEEGCVPRKKVRIRHYPETRYNKKIDFKKEMKVFYDNVDKYNLSSFL